MVSNTLLPSLQRMCTRRLHSFKFLHRYSAAAQQPQPLCILQNYLISSIGFTPEAAFAATKKLRRSESFRNDPDLVVDYMKRLGLNNDQIKSMISSCPIVLTYDVSKTLEPKIRVLHNIGLSESDIVKILCAYPCLLQRGVESHVKRIQFLKELLGSNDNVAKALRNYAMLLDSHTQKSIESRLLLLRETGISDHQISHFLVHYPKRILQPIQWLQDVLHRVEHDLGIPSGSRMFYHGVMYLSGLTKSKIEDKLGVFGHFGWSADTIHNMVSKFPAILGPSEGKLRNCLGFLMGELGCSPEMLASNPVVFCLSVEKMKLRNDVLNVLNEKKLNQRKQSHFAALVVGEKIFLKNYLLPHQTEIPFLYKSYMEKIGSGIK